MRIAAIFGARLGPVSRQSFKATPLYPLADASNTGRVRVEKRGYSHNSRGDE